MENYGCTSPFGPKKGNICMDQLKGEKVAKFHTNQIPGTISKQTQDGQCLNPCSYFSILQLRGSGIAGTATGTGSGTDAGTATGTASGTATGTSTGTASGTVTTGTPRMIEVTITFEELIKVTTGKYLYSELSLIAEIGGYVGLFLGVSVNQISNFLDFLLRIQ